MKDVEGCYVLVEFEGFVVGVCQSVVFDLSIKVVDEDFDWVDFFFDVYDGFFDCVFFDCV